VSNEIKDRQKILMIVISGVTGSWSSIFPLSIFESELPYSSWNASLLNEGNFANFAQKWLPWQPPLRNRKIGLDP